MGFVELRWWCWGEEWELIEVVEVREKMLIVAGEDWTVCGRRSLVI